MNKIISIFLLCFIALFAQAQYKKNYEIYTAKGKKTNYGKMLKSAKENQVILFGEEHNSAIAHWLELALAKDIRQQKVIIMGAEMIESDNQKALNLYLDGSITQKGLDTMARLWPNYETDYKPLIDYAKQEKFPFIATNIPRCYASKVFKRDFIVLDSLTAAEKAWIAPLPIPYDPTLPGYVNMKKMMDGQHNSDLFPKAQAVKDATMAHFITTNLKPNSIFIHYNGAYHSNNHEGIYWYLKKYNSALKIMTIATVTQKDINTLDKEYLGLADYILVVDEAVTRTY